MIRALARLSPHLLATSLSLSMLAIGGCKKPEYPACKKDKHCDKDNGEACVDGTCQNCKADPDCAGKGPDGVDFKCIEFRCQDPSTAATASGNGEQGAPCTQISECVGGLTCKAGACDLCAEDFDCGTRTCNLDTGRCSAEGMCETDDQCPMDEICDGGICVFSGDLDADGQTGVCGLDAIYFGFDSDTITASNMEKITAAAECLTQHEGTLTLEAHADDIGTQDYNIMLTDRRGNVVKSALTDLGVAADKITVIGKGSLLASGTDEASRAKDRRVSFIWQ